MTSYTPRRVPPARTPPHQRTPANETASVQILRAETPADVAAAKALCLDYAAFLDLDLSFQGFDAEMADFPAGYRLVLLARRGDAPAGVVGLKHLGPDACEMKRLFVPDAHRGAGLGRLLCERLTAEARDAGYRLMRLDTLSRLHAALALYRKLGFAAVGERPGYYRDRQGERRRAIVMRRDLASPRKGR